jgi:hypothetical protein
VARARVRVLELGAGEIASLGFDGPDVGTTALMTGGMILVRGPGALVLLGLDGAERARLDLR